MKRLNKEGFSIKSNTSLIVGLIAVFMFVFSLNSSVVSRIFGYGLTTPSAPTCGDARPATAPDLFQVDTSGNAAKLFFTPISNTNTYYFSFSTKSNAEENGVQATLGVLGVQNFTIDHLKYNTTYYFKVRGQNGCMPGEWSNIMSITTRTNFYTQVVSFFKNSIFNPITKYVKTALNITTPTENTTEETTVLNPAPAPTTVGKAVDTKATVKPIVVPQQVDVNPVETTTPDIGFWQRILNFFKSLGN